MLVPLGLRNGLRDGRGLYPYGASCPRVCVQGEGSISLGQGL